MFELLLEDIDRIQPGLPEHLQHPSELKSKLLLAVLGLPECNLAARNPAATWEGLCDSLRSSIATTLRNGTNSQYFNNQYKHQPEHQPEHQHELELYEPADEQY